MIEVIPKNTADIDASSASVIPSPSPPERRLRFQTVVLDGFDAHNIRSFAWPRAAESGSGWG